MFQVRIHFMKDFNNFFYFWTKNFAVKKEASFLINNQKNLEILTLCFAYCYTFRAIVMRGKFDFLNKIIEDERHSTFIIAASQNSRTDVDWDWYAGCFTLANVAQFWILSLKVEKLFWQISSWYLCNEYIDECCLFLKLIETLTK